MFQGGESRIDTDSKTNPYVDIAVGGISKVAALTSPLAGQRMVIGLVAIAIGVLHILMGSAMLF
jgi:hypothetical protein